MSHYGTDEYNERHRAWRRKTADRLNAQSRARYAKNRDALLAKARIRREKNREKLREVGRRWRARNPKSSRVYYQKNPPLVLWRCARSRAAKRGMAFDISVADVVIPARCPVLGTPISLAGGAGMRDHSPTLDRIDNAKGYVKGNVQVISWRANRIKSDATAKELLLLLLYMERHQ